jgi:predicted  nucleic acid-binding Zn-ribbon protein
LKVLQKEYNQFQEQTKELRSSIVDSEKELGELRELRQKIVDMVSFGDKFDLFGYSLKLSGH